MSFIKMRLSHNLVPLCNSRTWHRHNLPYPCYAIICPCRSLSVVILLVLLLSTLSETAVDHACPMSISEPVTDEARLVDGMLRIGNPERVYDASQFRFAVNGSGYELCTCTLKPCVLKCCDRGYLKNLSCPVPDDNESIRSFMVPKLVTQNGAVESFKAKESVLVHKILQCSENAIKYIINPFILGDNDSFQVSENGSLLIEMGSLIVSPGQFCLEQFSEDDSQLIAIVCSEQNTENFQNEFMNDNIRLLYLTGLILSMPFLFMTFIVYALIKKLRNLHGKCLMCYVASLLVAYASLITVQLTNPYSIKKDICILFCFIVQFSFLASFSWLSVMCFDLWINFSGSGSIKIYLRENQSKKFMIYCIFAWGCTCLISIVTYFMQFKFKGSLFFYPGIGETSCWFSTSSALMLYFYGPIMILLICNSAMFIHISMLMAGRSLNEMFFRNPNYNINKNRQKQRVTLYFNLFIVMGLNWLAEILSWLLEDYFPSYVWVITDVGNALQGVFIFIFFVCKKNVLKLVIKKCCPGSFQNFTTVANNTTCTDDSESNSSDENPFELNSDNLQNSSNLFIT